MIDSVIFILPKISIYSCTREQKEKGVDTETYWAFISMYMSCQYYIHSSSIKQGLHCCHHPVSFPLMSIVTTIPWHMKQSYEPWGPAPIHFWKVCLNVKMVDRYVKPLSWGRKDSQISLITGSHISRFAEFWNLPSCLKWDTGVLTLEHVS